jgi:hypothetical protein
MSELARTLVSIRCPLVPTPQFVDIGLRRASIIAYYRSYQGTVVGGWHFATVFQLNVISQTETTNDFMLV